MAGSDPVQMEQTAIDMQLVEVVWELLKHSQQTPQRMALTTACIPSRSDHLARRQVIHVNLTQHDNDTEPVKLEPGARVKFTYAVTWTPTDTQFSRRFEKYLDYSFFEHKVRAGALGWTPQQLPTAAQPMCCACSVRSNTTICPLLAKAELSRLDHGAPCPAPTLATDPLVFDLQ